MNAAPQVSIIIPTHNRPVLLRRSLASALAQEGAAIEVVVVDDGSDPPVRLDQSADVILVRTENQGVSAARNAGLDRARGTYILFLDSDDWLEPDAVSNLLRTIEAHRAGVAFGAWRNIDAATGDESVIGLALPYADGLANAVAGGWVIGSFLMARTTASRFRPSLRVWEVTTFLCESLADGDPVATCDRVVVNIAQHSDPSRITIRHDHFEPLAMARAFAAMKADLDDHGLLNKDRLAALDAKLLASLHALVRSGRPEAREVYEIVDWVDVARRKSCRPGSFIWCARWGGLAGARGFMAVHRALGR